MSIGSTTHHQPSVASSFDWAKAHLDTAADGTLFWADEIEQCRGRGTRTWTTDPGQLLLTFLLKPSISDDLALRRLVMAMGLGFRQVLVGVQLKWPNDFVLNDKKMGGMLVETVWRGEDLAGVLIGVGLNINNTFAPDNELFATATSLSAATGTTYNRDQLCQTICSATDSWYERWRKGEDVFTPWVEAQAYVDREITVHDLEGDIHTGTVAGFAPNGDLRLATDAGEKVISFDQTSECTVR